MCTDDVTRLIDVSTILVEIVITVSISQWPKTHMPTIVFMKSIAMEALDKDDIRCTC